MRAECGTSNSGECATAIQAFIEGDGHLVTDKNAASLQRSVPGEAEVFAVNLFAICNRM